MDRNHFSPRNGHTTYDWGPLEPALDVLSSHGHETRVTGREGDWQVQIVSKTPGNAVSPRPVYATGTGASIERALRAAFGAWAEAAPGGTEAVSAMIGEAYTKRRESRHFLTDLYPTPAKEHADLFEASWDVIHKADKRLRKAHGKKVNECRVTPITLFLEDVDEGWTATEWFKVRGQEAWEKLMRLVAIVENGGELPPILVTGHPRRGYEVIYGEEFVVAHSIARTTNTVQAYNVH